MDAALDPPTTATTNAIAPPTPPSKRAHRANASSHTLQDHTSESALSACPSTAAAPASLQPVSNTTPQSKSASSTPVECTLRCDTCVSHEQPSAEAALPSPPITDATHPFVDDDQAVDDGCDKDDDDDDTRSHDSDDDAGSLVDFIVDDEADDDSVDGDKESDAADNAMAEGDEVQQLFDSLRPSERLQVQELVNATDDSAQRRSRRVSRAPRRFVEEYADDIARVLLEDVPEDEISAALESDDDKEDGDVNLRASDPADSEDADGDEDYDDEDDDDDDDDEDYDDTEGEGEEGDDDEGADDEEDDDEADDDEEDDKNDESEDEAPRKRHRAN